MSARTQAIQDMMPELKKRNKSFIAFRRELNPVMRKLVSQQIKEQQSITPFSTPTHSTSQLIAHCFFAHGQVEYNNYDKYYAQQEEQEALNRIEMEVDY